MKRWRQHLGVVTGLATLVAVLSFSSAGPVIAKNALNPMLALIVNDSSQPVPVTSVDERGRAPFSYDQVGDCNVFNCFMDFPVVPAGQRLVILHVGAIARPSSTSTIVDQAELRTSNTTNPNLGVRNSFPMALIGQAGQNVSSHTWGMNHPVLAYVEPGHFARVTLLNRDPGQVFFSQATISGYFVALQ